MHTLHARSYFLLKDNSNHEVLTLWLKRNGAISLSCNTIIILSVLNSFIGYFDVPECWQKNQRLYWPHCHSQLRKQEKK